METNPNEYKLKFDSFIKTGMYIELSALSVMLLSYEVLLKVK